MITDIRPFPIQGEYRNEDGEIMRPVDELPSCTIPWWLAELAYREYSRRYGTSQSLERMAERGGFGRWEFLALLSPAALRQYEKILEPRP